MKSKQFPSVPEELLKALEEKFPNALPTSFENLTVIDVARKMGAQEVVNYLRLQFEKQNTTVLENN
ncbi:hypothetical protein bb8_p38 [Bordetella phage vB_BbrP_BB8]|uniref:Uncharacterized protein n=1 Tax=Bordetella phage vB_BbrP_BB8 TaxID=2587820 RepID=A0A4Y5TPX5_9CAUD|nr:hypothetical protein bb8_p38 [Bordetella phage vB_BbrP_BB8]